MKKTLLLLSLVGLTSICACKNKKKESRAPVKIADGSSPVGITTMFELHYRYTPEIDSLQRYLSPQMQRQAALMWNYIRELTTIDLWVFPAEHIPGTAYRARTAGCARGKGRKLIAVLLKTPNGKPMVIKEGAVYSFSNKNLEGGQEYSVMDNGKRLCIASSRELLVKAMGWKPLAAKSQGHFLDLILNTPSLFASRSFLGRGDNYLEQIASRAGDQKPNVLAFFSAIKEIKLVRLDFQLSKQAGITLTAPLFFPRENRLPSIAAKTVSLVDRLCTDCMIEAAVPLSGGKLWGFSIKPFLSQVPNPVVKRFLTAGLEKIEHLHVSAVKTERQLHVLPRVTAQLHEIPPMLLEQILDSLKDIPGVPPLQLVKSADDAQSAKFIWDRSRENQTSLFTDLFGEKGEMKTRIGNSRFYCNRKSTGLAKQSGIHLLLRPFSLARLYLSLASKGTPPQGFQSESPETEPPVRISLTGDPSQHALVFSLSVPLGLWLEYSRKYPHTAMAVAALLK